MNPRFSQIVVGIICAGGWFWAFENGNLAAEYVSIAAFGVMYSLLAIEAMLLNLVGDR